MARNELRGLLHWIRYPDPIDRERLFDLVGGYRPPATKRFEMTDTIDERQDAIDDMMADELTRRIGDVLVELQPPFHIAFDVVARLTAGMFLKTVFADNHRMEAFEDYCVAVRLHIERETANGEAL